MRVQWQSAPALQGIFDDDEEDILEALFQSDRLEDIVYRNSVENILSASGLPSNIAKFDLFVKVRRRLWGLWRDGLIGVTYWPNGPVLQGIQQYTEGETLVFQNVPVIAGGVLIVAMDWGLTVEVSAQRPGTAPPPVDEGPPIIPPDLGLGLGIGSTVIAAMALYWFLGPPRK